MINAFGRQSKLEIEKGHFLSALCCGKLTQVFAFTHVDTFFFYLALIRIQSPGTFTHSDATDFLIHTTETGYVFVFFFFSYSVCIRI